MCIGTCANSVPLPGFPLSRNAVRNTIDIDAATVAKAIRALLVCSRSWAMCFTYSSSEEFTYSTSEEKKEAAPLGVRAASRLSQSTQMTAKPDSDGGIAVVIHRKVQSIRLSVTSDDRINASRVSRIESPRGTRRWQEQDRSRPTGLRQVGV